MKKFSFDINGGNYEVYIKSLESDIAEIEVNGTPYSVQINKITENTNKNLTAPAPSAPKSTVLASVPAVKSIGNVKSPLPGNVFKVNVGVGQSFKEGDVLMVMESMKMENNILAEANGTITKVLAPVGSAVLQDEVLFEYETSGSVVVNQVVEVPKAVAVTPNPAAPVAAKGSKSIKSPLPGNILKVNVGVGQSFKEGDVLMIMESMKMENNILAEANGTVTKVLASVGSAVLQDEVLFEYE
jgi:biotin carboxyl carrier protein